MVLASTGVRPISPVSIEILAASTHTHALGLSAVTLVLAWLALLTSWPRAIVGLLVGATGLGLLLDIGSWWLTREWIEFAYLIMGAGAVLAAGVKVGILKFNHLVDKGLICLAVACRKSGVGLGVENSKLLLKIGGFIQSPSNFFLNNLL